MQPLAGPKFNLWHSNSGRFYETLENSVEMQYKNLNALNADRHAVIKSSDNYSRNSDQTIVRRASSCLPAARASSKTRTSSDLSNSSDLEGGREVGLVRPDLSTTFAVQTQIERMRISDVQS